MSTPLSAVEFKEAEFARLSVSPTSEWANLGGQFRGLPTPVYGIVTLSRWSGKIA
ncbi:hypothetical protein OKW33_006394 [Paraburkholderia atlantica]|uniref:Uncharacterized protein n=1 Tax=Paraburkholderia atlantica TaxID=2654982 RepID=A0A7W8VB16_PARAM|nr:hypothetical protein [Paraburkholderia atlantica]MBB5429657.1 hypothetical protein [Paraburkholderia atlantica]